MILVDNAEVIATSTIFRPDQYLSEAFRRVHFNPAGSLLLPFQGGDQSWASISCQAAPDQAIAAGVTLIEAAGDIAQFNPLPFPLDSAESEEELASSRQVSLDHYELQERPLDQMAQRLQVSLSEHRPQEERLFGRHGRRLDLIAASSGGKLDRFHVTATLESSSLKVTQAESLLEDPEVEVNNTTSFSIEVRGDDTLKRLLGTERPEEYLQDPAHRLFTGGLQVSDGRERGGERKLRFSRETVPGERGPLPVVSILSGMDFLQIYFRRLGGDSRPPPEWLLGLFLSVETSIEREGKQLGAIDTWTLAAAARAEQMIRSGLVTAVS